MSIPGNSGLTAREHSARRVRWEDAVRVDFMVWLEDGTLVASSIYSEPLVFTAGAGSVIEGLQQLIVGMSVGESKTETIPPDRAFGQYRSALACEVGLSWLQAQGVVPLVGLGLEVCTTDGTTTNMVVTKIDGDRLTLDANHRLAGKTIVVRLELLEILGDAGSRWCADQTPMA